MKKKVLIAFLWILVVGFLLSLMPWSRNVSVHTTACEYALDQEEPLQIHDVTIEGRYYFGIWREPYFDGTFSVSGFPFSLEEPARIRFDRALDNLGVISFRDSYGQPRSRELNQLRCTPDFSEFVILVFELEQNGDRVTGRWSPETGRVLCTNAPDYDALQAQCRQLDFDIWGGE